MHRTRDILKIGNAQGFWGDDGTAPARLVAQQPDLDVLTLDYLAEVSMSILAKQRARNSALGYAQDFLSVVGALIPHWKSGRKLTLVTNSGGLNPRGCAEATLKLLREAGVSGKKIALITGDDVLPLLQAAAADPASKAFCHLESHKPLATVADRLATANAYVGAASIAEALRDGADIVIGGRIADPSLAVGPSAAFFGWAADDYHRLAGATVAGHLIECGTQVCGGIFTDWLKVPNADIGFPIIEIGPDGSCVVTKPAHTGGVVSPATVKEQLLYELGDPGHYLSPDCQVSFLTLGVDDVGPDRVRVAGATGSAPTSTYKVSATYRAGYKATGSLTILGRDAVAKARRCADLVRERLSQLATPPARFHAELIGAGELQPGSPPCPEAREIYLRLSVADDRKEPLEAFARMIAPLVTSGPQGTTGYADGRPDVREVFGYWPTLVDRTRVPLVVDILEV